MDIGTTFKKFFVHMVAGSAVSIVRGYLNGQLEKVKPSDLYEAIKYDTELWGELPPDIKQQARSYRKSYRKLFDEFSDQITTEVILGWIKEDHMALYSTIINTPDNRGIIWLDIQIKKIKAQLIGM